jgi:hypothetical protein
MFDELIFTETSFYNYTLEEKRDNLKQIYEAGKEIGASMLVLEGTLMSKPGKTAPDIRSENLGFFTGLPLNPTKTDLYYAFLSDVLSLAS